MFPFIFLERIRSIPEQTDVSEVVHRAKEDAQTAGSDVKPLASDGFDLATPSVDGRL